MAMIEPGPTARHRRLAAELKRLRNEADLTPENAARVLGWSRPKLVRIENTTQMPSLGDVAHILDAYGGPSEAIKLAIMQLARDVRQRGWWAAYGDVLAGAYVELEDAANLIRTWQVQLIPGLLQTRAYARTLIATAVDDPAELDRRVEARVHRQSLLSRENAPHLDVLLAEEVLHRPPNAEVMRDQAKALLFAAEQPNVDIRIVPVAAGLHHGVGQGSLVIFDFASPVELGVAYLETLAGGVYVEETAQVQRCNVAFGRIADAALSSHESAEMIAAVAKE